jgi:hypothetical protein
MAETRTFGKKQIIPISWKNLKLVTHQQMHYLLNFERFNFALKLT